MSEETKVNFCVFKVKVHNLQTQAKESDLS